MNEKEFTTQQQIKSKERVRDLAEVFTAEREVNDMLNLVKDESYRVDSKFLEPSCGNGNFLVSILQRKLDTVSKECHTQKDYEYQTLVALSSIYGVDISQENVDEAKERLQVIALLSFSTHMNTSHYSPEFFAAMHYILDKNIICGDMLNKQADVVFHEFIPVHPYQFTEQTETLVNMLESKENPVLVRENTPYWQLTPHCF